MKQQIKILDGWEELELRDLGEVSTGKTPSTSNKSFWGEEIPFITPSDFNNHGIINSTERKISKEGIKEANGLLPINTVLVVCIGSTIGKLGITGRPSVTNQQINSIVCNEKTDPHFVYFQLLKNSGVFKSHSGVSAVPIINKSQFEKIKIRLPKNKDGQIAISRILSEIDFKLDNVERERDKQQSDSGRESW